MDFFTGWEVKKFTPELEPQPGQPDRTQVVEAAELIAGQVGSDLTVTKRYVKDAEEDPLLLRLEEIIERQEEATEEETRPRPRPGQRRAPHY